MASAKPIAPKKRTPPKPSQNPERNTVTQAISFDRQIYELMEAARFEPRIPTPRSRYVCEALEMRMRREGRLK
jgi:hypothetical protein